ncbi:hypothetical protein VNO77_27537 [Canavalia gladiata]|uniref:Uncharacterized protein n=1 Tax=Canavalia gladiata TaxID=3824 RepID=A0AAN9KUV4_CANGL
MWHLGLEGRATRMGRSSERVTLDSFIPCICLAITPADGLCCARTPWFIFPVTFYCFLFIRPWRSHFHVAWWWLCSISKPLRTCSVTMPQTWTCSCGP